MTDMMAPALLMVSLRADNRECKREKWKLLSVSEEGLLVVLDVNGKQYKITIAEVQENAWPKRE